MRALFLAAGLLANVTPIPAAAGAEWPELRLDDLEGRSRSLAVERGRIVVVNFWATWCLPCREEMPLLSAVHERYDSGELLVIGVSTDAGDQLDQVTRFVRDHGLDFDIWIGGSPEVMHRFGVGEALPATAILDRDGSVAMRILGPLQPGDLESRIDWLLGPRVDPAPESSLDRFSVGPDHGGEAEVVPDGHGSGQDHGEHDHGEHAPHRHDPDADDASLVPS